MPELSELPHSREAEEAVLGAVLINADIYDELAEFLTAEDFYLHRHRFIWQVYTRLSGRQIPIDSLTTSVELEDMGRLEEIGGPAYLTALLNQVPTTLHAEAYGQIVRATALRRQLLTAANKIATLAYDQSAELPTIIEQAVAALEAAVRREIGSALVSFSEALSNAYDTLDRLSRTIELPGTPTGFLDLDLRLGNLQSGALYVIAARPGQGKTALMLSIALNAARAGKRVAVFSLEMPTGKITNRLLAQATGLNVQLLDTGKVSAEDWPKLPQAIDTLETLPLFIDDTPSLTPLQLKAKLRRLHLTAGKIDLVIVDYIQLMHSGGRAENRTQEVGLVSRSLKALSKELNVPILAAAQLNREVEKRGDKKPQLSDLRESGDIEADADVVIFLHPTAPPAENGFQPVDLLIAKHRNGPTGEVATLFRKTTTRFENAVKRTITLNED